MIKSVLNVFRFTHHYSLFIHSRLALANDTLGWMVTQDVRKNGTAVERNFRFSEWDPDSAKNMCDNVRHLPCPYGGTLGDILDETPNEVISKVMLEDKV